MKRGISTKRRKQRMEVWLRSREGRAYVRMFRHRTPEEAAAIREILKK